MERPKKLYLVWREDLGHYNQYDSLQEAVEDNCISANSPPVEVCEVEPKVIGKFVVMIKMKKVE